MKKWIILGVLLALTILFAILKSVWTGFVYFAIASLTLMCLYITYLLIKKYIFDYHANFESEFLGYRADYINSNNITREEFDDKLTFHLKSFKKILKKEKFIDIFKILFVISIFAVCIVTIIKL